MPRSRVPTRAAGLVPAALLLVAVPLASVPGSASAQPAPRADSIFARGMAHFQMGRYGAAARRFSTAAEMRPHDSGRAYNAAVAWARAGKPDRALRWLRRVTELGAYHPVDVKAFEPLRERPEFKTLVERFRSILAPVARGRVAFRVGPSDLLPESIAHDPVEDVFYVGSLHRRKILRVDVEAGMARDFVSEGAGGIWGVHGLAIDAGRRELWATACNLGGGMPMSTREPETVGRTGVFRFALERGALVRAYLAGSPSDSVCFNDLAVGEDGTVFLSAGKDGVYWIRPGADSVRRFVTGPGFRASGLDLTPDGSALYLANGRWGVVRIDVADARTSRLDLPDDMTLNGVDGLYVHDGSLVAIQSGHSPPRVVQVFLDSAGRRADSLRLLDSNHPAFSGPTTGTLVGDTLYYVATSQLRRAFDPAGRIRRDELSENVILKTPLFPGPGDEARKEGDDPEEGGETEGPTGGGR